ncbi:hypothetical protein [Gaoshiqia sp. Z1-71]|uniref:hypothetical protein n=1 Tax=Gaoshiqia hydrogeniformans TaxID=3290090 RepID=UPI003BF915E2
MRQNRASHIQPPFVPFDKKDKKNRLSLVLPGGRKQTRKAPETGTVKPVGTNKAAMIREVSRPLNEPAA